MTRSLQWRVVWVLGLGVWLGLAGLAGAQSPAATAQSQSNTDALRQVAGILDYIAGDYRAAVGPDRAILSQEELTEQRSLARDADALAAQAGVAQGAGIRAVLVELSAVLDQVASPDQVATVCKRARQVLVEAHGLTLAPETIPDIGRAASTYVSAGCPSCHGVDGSANTEAAAKLDPPPANFRDPERVATVSAHRAFFAITYGVSGTGMTGYRQLSEADRWSLAFYVLSLRHDAALKERGKAALEQHALDIPRNARGLATWTEEELAARVKVAGPEAAAALSYLRLQAPFEAQTQSNSLLGLHRALHAGLDAYRSGDATAARRRFVAAYLDELEPREAGIRARDAALVADMERTMLALREAAATAGQAVAIERHVQHMDALIARAESQGTTPNAALISALTISLREGFEIALLIGALLGLVRKRGQLELVRYVHAGWLLAIPAGLLTWWLAGSVLGGLERELAEGIAALSAAVVLLGVTHWLLGQVTAKRFMGFVGSQLNASTSASSKAGVLGIAFLAAYREAFEVVLFFQALLLDAGDARGHVWLGVALGAVVLVAATLVLRAIGQRLSPRPFMLASSGLLAALAVVLVGKGIRALQEAGVLGVSTLSELALPTLGIHATIEGLMGQGVLLLLLLGSAFWAWLQNRRQTAALASRAAE